MSRGRTRALLGSRRFAPYLFLAPAALAGLVFFVLQTFWFRFLVDGRPAPGLKVTVVPLLRPRAGVAPVSTILLFGLPPLPYWPQSRARST